MKKISRQEKRAARTGGVLDDRIPEAELREHLGRQVQRSGKAREFDLDKLLPEIANRVAWARLDAPRMEPAEIREQAEQTVAVLDDLLARFRHMHPDLDAWTNDALYRATGEFSSELVNRISPDLYRLRAALNAAAEKIEGRPGRKRTAWEFTRDAIADALGEHSRPKLAKADRRELAGELIELCGLPDLRGRQ